MTPPRVLVLRAAGTNCDEETAFAWEQAGARPERVHVNRLIESPTILERFQILTIPGGFSYGDDIASGKIFANQIRHHLLPAIREWLDRGRLILGICNGFQVLVKAGLLPGPGLPRATLTFNDSGRFEARWVRLRAARSACPLLKPGETLALPVAHAEGKVVLEPRTTEAAAETAFSVLNEAGCVPLRYISDSDGTADYPQNPNGSEHDIAGLCDPTGRILGLMPHPERSVLREQAPDWTLTDNADNAGFRLFRRAVALFQS
jgi:phosphoribosylformylglycinamidine synthase I